jgi:hypothetical protein
MLDAAIDCWGGSSSAVCSHCLDVNLSRRTSNSLNKIAIIYIHIYLYTSQKYIP